MNFEFNDSATAINTLSTSSIRIQAMKELDNAVESLKNEADELKENLDNLTEEELLELEEQEKEPDLFDSMMLDFALFGPLSGFLAGNFAIFEAINLSMVMACADAYDTATQSGDNALEGKLYDYPYGRVQFVAGSTIEEVEDDFNMACKSMKLGTGSNAKADKSRMYDILNMLDKVEKQGLSHVEMTEKASVFDSLKSLNKDLKGFDDVFSVNPVDSQSYMVA